ACLTQFTVIGLLFSYGLLIKEFETEFGWSRTLLSASTSIAFLMMAFWQFRQGGCLIALARASCWPALG
ncbi:MAG: hypothetical protein ACPGGK_16910, partial [Pikeienuella sp.]